MRRAQLTSDNRLGVFQRRIRVDGRSPLSIPFRPEDEVVGELAVCVRAATAQHATPTSREGEQEVRPHQEVHFRDYMLPAWVACSSSPGRQSSLATNARRELGVVPGDGIATCGECTPGMLAENTICHLAWREHPAVELPAHKASVPILSEGGLATFPGAVRQQGYRVVVWSMATRAKNQVPDHGKLPSQILRDACDHLSAKAGPDGTERETHEAPTHLAHGVELALCRERGDLHLSVLVLPLRHGRQHELAVAALELATQSLEVHREAIEGEAQIQAPHTHVHTARRQPQRAAHNYIALRRPTTH
mmetsp:Transcript_73645/g.158002  ORF Transcript_73645/g.158002 Transcript_73645/m.158002 type:complete len:306 (+) Transcript_73645:49-966(+)